ncbi:PKD domain-containing protein [Candidatus Woesearchaeota archaeon]|nr:PKD domain-containing protein [Candidatus Woesearchaeota archaeon]
MKKILLLLIIFVLAIWCVQAQIALDEPRLELSLYAAISTPPPQDSGIMTIATGGSIVFESLVFGGDPNYDYFWDFCGDCVPQEHTCNNCNPTELVDPPGGVTFNSPGTYTVELTVIDDNGLGTIKTDDFRVNVGTDMASITWPEMYTGWPMRPQTVHFEASTTDPDNGLTYNYLWDFGDGNTSSENVLGWGYSSTVDYGFGDAGTHIVTVTVTNSNAVSDSATVTIYIIEPTLTEFHCNLEVGSCAVEDIELMRFYSRFNTHARGFEDPLKNSYNYLVCCRAGSLWPEVRSSYPTGKPVFAVLQNDSESEIGGGHRNGSVDSLKQKYYYLEGSLGEGTECQAVEGKCSNIVPPEKFSCVYEFYYDETIVEPPSTHFANCSEKTDSNNYPFQMCCQIAEDCTNNIDDNSNTWADTADNENPTTGVCLEGTICGISNQLQFDDDNDDATISGSCDWMKPSSEGGDGFCTADGVDCDFTSIGNPDHQLVEGYRVQKYIPGTGLCRYKASADGVNIELALRNSLNQPNPAGCPDGATFKTDICNLGPSFCQEATDRNVNILELYWRCRYFHCSIGGDPNNPLPAYVQNMTENNVNTRHICELGWYWNPEKVNPDGSVGGCQESQECFSPLQDLDCDYDFSAGFDIWMADLQALLDEMKAALESTHPIVLEVNTVADLSNLFNDPSVDSYAKNDIEEWLETNHNCFDLYPVINNLNPECCCPIWISGSDQYNYEEIGYYVQQATDAYTPPT